MAMGAGIRACPVAGRAAAFLCRDWLGYSIDFIPWGGEFVGSAGGLQGFAGVRQASPPAGAKALSIHGTYRRGDPGLKSWATSRALSRQMQTGKPRPFKADANPAPPDNQRPDYPTLPAAAGTTQAELP